MSKEKDIGLGHLLLLPMIEKIKINHTI